MNLLTFVFIVYLLNMNNLLTPGATTTEDTLINEVSILSHKLRKCECNAHEVLIDGECSIQNTFVAVLDWQTLVENPVDTSTFNISVEDLKCVQPDQELILSPHEFVLTEDGYLHHYTHNSQFDHSTYCIEHILDQEGSLSWMAKICSPPPAIPRCCFEHLNTDIGIESCNYDDSEEQFLPPIFVEGAILKSNNLPVIPINLNCPEVTVVTIGHPSDHESSTLIYYQDIGQLILNYTEKDILQESNFCIYKINTLYYASICKSTPIRMCCSEMEFLNNGTCQPSHEIININVYDSNNYTQVQPPDHLWSYYNKPLDCDMISLDGVIDQDYFILNTGNLFDGHKEYKSIEYCIGSEINLNNFSTKAYKCLPELVKDVIDWTEILTNVFTVISCFFLLFTLIIYLTVPDLRNRVSGRCLMCEVTALLAAFLALVVSNSTHLDNFSNTGCHFIGIFIHYTLLASFFWLNVMCYDMWSTLTRMYQVNTYSKGCNKRFLLYSLYGWGAPLVIVSTGAILDLIPPSIISENSILRPYIAEFCFVSIDPTTKWAYMFGPMLILIIVNLGFFIHVVVILKKTAKENKKMFATTVAGPNRANADKQANMMCFKLFCVMGVTWILEIFSFSILTLHKNVIYYTLIFNLINALRGVYIFIIFICKKTTINKIRKAWHPQIEAVNTIRMQMYDQFRSSSRTETEGISESGQIGNTTFTSLGSSPGSNRLPSSGNIATVPKTYEGSSYLDVEKCPTITKSNQSSPQLDVNKDVTMSNINQDTRL